MAMVMDQQQQQGGYKYYCRICKKGFGCGRALGGHMRAHGVNDDAAAGHGDNENDPSGGEWEDKLNPPPGSKRMYALRTNTNRLKSCRVCENCGKEFVSWKSFLEHGRCNSDDEAGGAGGGSLASSPRSEGEDDAHGTRGCGGWSKGKRSRRAKGSAAAAGAIGVLHCPSSEEEDLANCLMMLSAARVDPVVVVAEAEESCASASKDEEFRRHAMAPDPTIFLAVAAKAPAVPRGMFECKACKKVFSSHQALGGHRASHKKVKGCFAAKLADRDVSVPPDDEVISQDNNQHSNSSNSEALAMAIVPFNNEPLVAMPLKGKSKVHECSICCRVFSSGQALGGHKRCHWITSNTPEPGTLGKLQLGSQPNIHHHQLQLRPMFECSEPPLDLNLPAPVDDLAGARQDIGSPLPLDMPTSIYIHTWADHINNNNMNNATTSNNFNNDASNPTPDDEADSQVRLAKLSELKDSNKGADSSPWLQVGIGSSANEGREP